MASTYNCCFVVNNYDGTEIEVLRNWPQVSYCSVGYEVGETGTPHLQGYAEFKQQVMWTTLANKLPRAWSEQRTGYQSGRKGAIQYTQKGDQTHAEWDATGNEGPTYGVNARVEVWGKPCAQGKKAPRAPPPPPPEAIVSYAIELNLNSWEQDIVDRLATPPDDRTIHWYWRDAGCAGKTVFQKWLYLNYPRVVVLSGKGADMKHSIIKYLEANDKAYPEIVIINFPRVVDTQFISWTGIEEVKDMFFFSGKYEGGMVCGPNPHVFCFANEPPPLFNMSVDRWHVVELGPDLL